MDEQRFVVTEELWVRLEPHLTAKKSDSGGIKPNACSWKPFFGACAPVCLRRICRQNPGTGTTCSGGSDNESKAMILSAISWRSAASPISTTRGSTAPSFRLNRRRAAQKGNLCSGRRALARWPERQDRSLSRCSREPERPCSPAGSGPRSERRRTNHQERGIRCASGRQGLRCRLAACGVEHARYERSHSSEREPQDQAHL